MNGKTSALALAPLLALGLSAGCAKKNTTAQPVVPPPVVATGGVSGEKVYLDNCAQCHMADGSGVPNMQPELIGSAIVSGDPATFEAVIRAGSLALRDRKSDFQNEMPPFGALSDDEVKAVMAYVRAKFGRGGGASGS